MMNLNPSYEIYLGALNLSPYVVDIVLVSINGWFEISCAELPLTLREDLHLCRFGRQTLYGLNYRPQQVTINRLRYASSTRSGVLSPNKSARDKLRFEQDAIYSIEGVFADGIPF